MGTKTKRMRMLEAVKMIKSYGYTAIEPKAEDGEMYEAIDRDGNILPVICSGGVAWADPERFEIIKPLFWGAKL